jgi:hypothetical protein
MTKKKPAPKSEPENEPTLTDQAKQVAEEYASDQRAIINRIRKPPN